MDLNLRERASITYKHVRGWGLKEMLILLMWFWDKMRQNAYIAYVKDQNSYSPENGF